MYAELEHREWTRLLIRLIRHCLLARFRPGELIVQKKWLVLQPGELRSFKKLFPITKKQCLERDMNQIFEDTGILLVENLAYSDAILRVGTLSGSCYRIMITMTWRILKSWNTLKATPDCTWSRLGKSRILPRFKLGDVHDISSAFRHPSCPQRSL